jgi:hypothetical protein
VEFCGPAGTPARLLGFEADLPERLRGARGFAADVANAANL